MGSSIFLIGNDKSLVELRQSPYDSEESLQQLLAEHPSVLGATDPSGRRLLLICRELGVPGDQAGPDRWSLDHLFVDHEGVPVLVEVKRATDTRARREVVAQMLDYAANGTAYWPNEQFIRKFEDETKHRGQDPKVILSAFIGETGAEAFWRRVETNLRSGRVRLIFAADRIGPELCRIVEFLNEQMRPAEVLAVEVEQFTNSDGVQTLVPRLVGNTQRAVASKAILLPDGAMSEQDLLDSLSIADRKAVDRLLDWLRQSGWEVGLPDGQKSISARVAASGGQRPSVPTPTLAARERLFQG